MSIELTDLQAGRILGCVEFCKSYDRQLEIHSHTESLKLLTPKLAEPKNFGAIVKDEDGRLWALCHPGEKTCWRSKTAAWVRWKDIPNPTVIYPGVEE